MTSPQPTRLSYLDEPFLLKQTATVLGVAAGEDGLTSVVLDRTVLYPQGGGQPSDTGRIRSAAAVLEVHDARLEDGVVRHRGRLASGTLEAGQAVEVEVDVPRRRLNSRLHSAGHLLDVAMENLGHAFLPAKGYHFPDGPYVEYEGVLPPDAREEVRSALELELARLIQEGFEVRFELDGPTRLVTVGGSKGWPCGGTHVRDIREIGAVCVTKIKGKAGRSRISYTLA